MLTVQHFKLLIVFLTMKRTRRQLKKVLLVSGVSIALVVFLFKYARRLKRSLFRTSNSRKSSPNLNSVMQTDVNTKSSPSFNRQFLNELVFLMKIMFPKFLSKQTSLLLMHTGTLVCRTFLSIYVAKLEGLLVKNIVRKDFNLFARNLLQWLLIAVPAVSCNSLIKYLESKLDIELKSQLVNRSLSLYFRDRIYYRIALKQNENVQIDQNLTEDIEKLTHLLVHLYSQLTKPILDISLITVTLISLAKQNNFNYLFPTAIAFIVIFCTGFLMRILSPKFGKMAANVAKQKGYLRFLYTRIQTNSEEIAFYSGEKTESTLIRKNYGFLKAQMEKIYLSKLWYVVIEQFLLKYVWSAAGLTMISLPILLSERKINKNKSNGNDLDAQANELEISERTEQFTTAKNLLIAAADAVERIMTSYKELIELTGFTRRVYDMFQMFDSAKKLDETRVDIKNDQNSAVAQVKSTTSLKSVSDMLGSSLNNNQMGVVCESINQNSIIVESISIVTPAGDLIVPSLTLKVNTYT
jgi:ATP-binding cassette subfamily D (ALD) protein 1